MSSAEDWAAEKLGHRFADPALLHQALTHKSLGAPNYERLEFLGDRVLGYATAAWLYERFPTESEGQLNHRFTRIVSGEMCARVARSLGVPAQLRLGAQARMDGGVDSDNILGDVMEALVGAVFRDAGVEAATSLICRAWMPLIDEAAETVKHPKSALQEWAASSGARGPVYELIRRFGPHHAPRFRVRLTVAPHAPVEAEGGSKQDAETEAARALLQAVGQ